jgi:hypothetical protein
MPNDVTLGDWYRTGQQDAANVAEVKQVVDDAGGDPYLAIDRQSWELEENKDEWFEQNADALDDTKAPREDAFVAWKQGWMSQFKHELKAIRPRPVSFGRMTDARAQRLSVAPEQWLAIRRQRAEGGGWGPLGDQAFERELIVRDTFRGVLEQTDPTAVPFLDEYPDLVRSALDPALDFYAVHSHVKERRDRSVYIFAAADDIFQIHSATTTMLKLELGRVTGTVWDASMNSEHVFLLWEGQPIVPRNVPNPKSVIASGSAWTNARDKLRSTVATTKKNGDLVPNSAGKDPVAFQRRIQEAKDIREHGRVLDSNERARLAARPVPRARVEAQIARERRNPASAQLEDAKAKFEEFHRKKPTKVGEFANSFRIPSQVGELGKAVHVLYRSNKKDPATGKQPKKPVDYIHEHYAGVKAYACERPYGVTRLEQCDVPDFITKCDALVLLGFCLGFRYKDDDGEHDAEGEEPLPELYATPCGKALLIIQSKKEVLAMIWGGGLGVWARGIDG